MRKHEMVYCFAKKTPEYDVSSHNKGKTRKIKPTAPKAEIYGITSLSKSYIFERDLPLPTSDITQEEQPNSWCEFNLDTNTGHRTAKPIKLMEFLLKYWTKEGQTILDPTMGSGSMGIACQNMNRNFIGIEMDKNIYELAKERISDAKSIKKSKTK